MRAIPCQRSPEFMQNLIQYTQITRDVRLYEEMLLQKRVEMSQMETRLLGEEIPLAGQRKLQADREASMVRLAMEPERHRNVHPVIGLNRSYPRSTPATTKLFTGGKDVLGELLRNAECHHKPEPGGEDSESGSEDSEGSVSED
jgi:hypothetical protein